MRLAVAPDQPVRADQHGGVVQLLSVEFEQPADDVNAEAPAGGGQHLRRRAWYLLGEGHRLGGAVENVPGDGALGEHEQLGTGTRGVLEARETDLEVPLLLPKLRLDLRHRDAHRATLLPFPARWRGCASTTTSCVGTRTWSLAPPGRGGVR